MTPRSQVIAAIAVLLIALVAVMALVGDAGVQSDVFSAQDTATPSPTPLPTATPVPVASADNWVESAAQPDSWDYADPSLDAHIILATNLTLEQAAANLGGSVPAEDAPLPGLALVTEFAEGFEAQVASQGEADARFEGPGTQLIGDQLVSIWRMAFSGPGLDPNLPNGADLALALVELDESQVTMVQYVVRSGPNDAVYADFEAWLATNMDTLTGASAEDADAADTDADDTDTESGAADTEDDATDTESETEDDADAESNAESEAEDADDDAEPDTDADAEDAGTDADDTAESDAADTESETEDDADNADTEDAEADTGDDASTADADAAPAQVWIEVGPGQLIYAPNPNVMVVHGEVTAAEVAVSVGIEVAEGDAPPTPVELLDAMKLDLETRYAEAIGEAIPPDWFTGPANVTYGGVQMAELGVNFDAVTDPVTGQESPPQSSRQLLIDLGQGNLYFVQFIAQGEIDPSVEADFETWLDENAASFLETEPAEDAGEVETPDESEETEESSESEESSD